MYFHIILTERCNSECRYCYKKSEEDFGSGIEKRFDFDFNAPEDSAVKISELKNFLLKDKNPKIIFYGGEPLCNIKKMKEIMDNIKADYYIQTNGKLLDKVSKECLNKFKKILISIDGEKEITDFNRGEGTFEKVFSNLKLIRNQGFYNEIVARMTLSFSDGFLELFKQVKYLLEIGFDSVHWQLDMGFYKFDFEEEKVKRFVDEYNKEVSFLLNFWTDKIKKGFVLKIYPFLGIADSILKKEKVKVRCGSGHMNYTITTDGRITCCPITNGIKNFYVGDIVQSNPLHLKKIFVSGQCISCNYLELCGGRCLYSNMANLWPREGEELICKTVKHLIDSIKEKIPEIKNIIKNGKILEKQFNYEKYFGPEIIP